jgi:hypothetical protein
MFVRFRETNNLRETKARLRVSRCKVRPEQILLQKSAIKAAKLVPTLCRAVTLGHCHRALATQDTDRPLVGGRATSFASRRILRDCGEGKLILRTARAA